MINYSKKILIDARWIRSLNIDGIGNFTLNVIIELTKYKDINFIIVSSSNQVENFIKSKVNLENISFITHQYDINSIKGAIKFSSLVSKTSPDIVFSPNVSITGFLPIKNHFVVVHDLIPIIFPDLFKNAGLKFKLFYSNKFIQRLSLFFCSKIIAVSNNTKKDLSNYLKIAEDKIDVITEGVIKLENTHNISSQFKIDKEYLLFVGRHEKYKNIDKVIEVYKQLPELIRVKYNLVIIGKSNPNITPNLKLISSDNKNILFFESLKPEELAYFYKNAKLLIHLSEYEGFGLTILEAMSYGIPVVASNISSIPEVVGKYDFLVDINNKLDILNKINTLLEDELLYKSTSIKLKKRAEEFSWSITAKQLIKIFFSS